MARSLKEAFGVPPDKKISLLPVAIGTVIGLGFLFNFLGARTFAGQPIGVFISVHGMGMVVSIALPLIVIMIFFGRANRPKRILLPLIIVGIFSYSAFVGTTRFAQISAAWDRGRQPAERNTAFVPGLREMVPDLMLAMRGETETTEFDNWQTVWKWMPMPVAQGGGMGSGTRRRPYIRTQHPLNAFQSFDMRISQELYDELNALKEELGVNSRGFVDEHPLRLYYLRNTRLVVDYQLLVD